MAATQFPPLTSDMVIRCSTPEWLPRFRRHTIKTELLQLSDEVLEWLRDGLFILPEGSSDDGDVDEGPPDSPNGSDWEETRRYAFPDLDAQMRDIIDRLGSVLPKLNWSAPQDAAWMSATQTLQCRTPADIYLLLKSSDFISHDLEHAFEGCVDEAEASRPPVQLVLKKWYELPRSNEFRCFVKDRRLHGISARDINYYDFLQPQDVRAQILNRIQAFYKETVQPGFAQDANYTFDVYLTRGFDRVFLVDFNPWSSKTDSLLFNWSELLESSGGMPLELRIVESQAQASQSGPRYASNRLPKDVTQLSEGQTIAEFAATWQAALAEASAEDMSVPGR